MFVFFFQAEDGIRDLTVTGVQTCALPISRHDPRTNPLQSGRQLCPRLASINEQQHGGLPRMIDARAHSDRAHIGIRSEEHTAELQSQSNIVCRLLLEKKKKDYRK